MMIGHDDLIWFITSNTLLNIYDDDYDYDYDSEHNALSILLSTTKLRGEWIIFESIFDLVVCGMQTVDFYKVVVL